MRLNLRRKRRAWTLFGVLVSLIAVLMLAAPDKSLEQTIFGFLLLVGGFSAVVYIDRVAVETGSCELVRQRGLVVPLYRQRYALDRTRCLVGDSGAVWVHWGGNKRDSAYLEAVIPYQILRLGRYAVSGTSAGTAP